MDSEVSPISASSSAHEVISTFQNLDLISLPVVDDENKLLGEITVDDVVDAIQDQANSDVVTADIAPRIGVMQRNERHSL